jgi:hypothetical protein
MGALIDVYTNEVDCSYKNEKYCVRDNGAVLRYPSGNNQSRPTDSKWTFGRLNPKTGYLEIASVPIHRVIATAFHGEPPTKEYVIDHIDTNKQNNRPENLRWVTRLENIILNPITAKRIKLVCGSVEEFLADPSKFRDKFQEPNYGWMCTVSKDEAQASKERLLDWAKSDKSRSGGALGEWIYNRTIPKSVIEEISEYTSSLTSKALQKNWKTPTEFPCCPNNETKISLTVYAANLQVNKIFSKNQNSSSIIEEFAFSKDKTALLVMCRSSENKAIKPYSLAKITELNNNFIHDNLGSFFQKEGALRQFKIAQDSEWIGGETFDELC